MNILAGKRVYLSSPIQHSVDGSWRKEVKEVLTSRFKLKVFDPAKHEDHSIKEKIANCKSKEDYEALSKIAHEFVRFDLSLIDRASIVIANVPYKIPTVGVCHEIINSNNAKKITLLVEGESKSKIAEWYFGFINPQFMFGKWTELYDFLEEVNQDKYINHNRFYSLYNYPDEWI